MLEHVRAGLQARGVAELTTLPLPEELAEARLELLRSWERLCQDQHMGDGGTYRFRRYSRMRLEADRLSALEGTSIYQSLEDNSLNGGRVRTFEPLEAETLANPFLHHLIRFDCSCLPAEPGPWTVGVHQVRILARPGECGHPAPEGVHIDGEDFTVQHLIARNNVTGGVFSAYDAHKRPWFHWLQLRTWESVFFTGKTWHGATPVRPRDPSRDGHRDILLVDFQRDSSPS